MGIGVIALLVVAGAAGALFLHRSFYFLQYLFFLRYPLLLGAALMLLPLTALDRYGQPFRNLFVLEGAGRLGIVTALALLVAWQVMYCVGFIYEHIGRRVHLRFVRSRAMKPQSDDAAAGGNKAEETQPDEVAPESRWQNPVPTILKSRVVRFFGFGLLAAPVVLASAWYSWKGAPPDPGSIGHVAGGLLAGLGIALFVVVVLGVVGPLPWVRRASDVAVRLSARLDQLLFGSTTIQTERATRDADAKSFVIRTEIVFAFAALTAVVYLGIGAFPPREGDALSRFDFPALLYILLLMMLSAWFLCWLSFMLDRHRLVPELVLVPTIALSYGVFGTDHFFRVEPRGEVWSAERCPAEQTPAAAGPLTTPPAEHWAKRQTWSDLEGPPVLVATSGGGITAAYWTAVVLAELERQIPLAGRAGFSDRVALVSGTSGGSVGSLFYVDAYDSKRKGPRPFDPKELARIQQGAGASSLNAVGWGLVYRDFWRVVFPPLVPRLVDRASSMETRWRQGLLPNRRRWDENDPATTRPVHDPSFGDWAEGVREGWRPAAVFNATLVESGELLQIANVALDTPSSDGEATMTSSRTQRRERTFAELYPGADVGAVTAARLSATFPWVTPAARPDLDPRCRELYHVADGGYYDNFGVLSALAYAEALPPVTRPILIEIRASDSSARGEPVLDGGFGLATIGPFKALLAVRATSQLARNDLLVSRAERAGRLTRVVFELKQRAPLSWHLSAREREDIEAGWQTEEVEKELGKLCSALGTPCSAS